VGVAGCIRWEKRDDIHDAFLGLAVCLDRHGVGMTVQQLADLDSRRMRATWHSSGYLLCSFFNATVVPVGLCIASNTSAWPPSGTGSRGQA
jgi:TRAP-type C4-dicarboxylate transport system permease small subunit